MNLAMSGWKVLEELALVQADVRLEAGGAVLIDEPLCIDLGLPSLLRSAFENVDPDPYADPEAWEKMPFFVCGCGDAECRAYAYRVRHSGDGTALWTEIELAPDGKVREWDSYTVGLIELRLQLARIADDFLKTVETVRAPSSLARTAELVKDWRKRLTNQGTAV